MDIENRQRWLSPLYDAIIQRRRSIKQPERTEKNSMPVVGDTPYGLAALHNECRELATTPEGGRNQALNNAAFKMGQLVSSDRLRHDTASRELFHAATIAGLSEREIEHTLRSALDAGMRFPRALPNTPTHVRTRPHDQKAPSTPPVTPQMEDAPLYERDGATVDETSARAEDRYDRGDRQTGGHGGSASPVETTHENLVDVTDDMLAETTSAAPVEADIPTNETMDEAASQAQSGRLDEGGSIDPELLLEYEQQGEYGDALLLASQISNAYVYDCNEKEWYIRCGHYYQKDSRHSLKRLVPGLLPGIYLDGATHFIEQAHKCRQAVKGQQGNVAQQTPRSGDEYGRGNPPSGGHGGSAGSENPQEQSFLKKVKKLSDRARLLTEVNRYRNVVFFTGALESMNLTSEAWDRDRWIIALDNCLLDLRTGLVRPWQSGDYYRTVCHTPWMGLEAPAPRWLQALDDMFANLPQERRTAMIAYLQRVMGYALSGSCVEHKAVLLYGPEGRNGKDTLIRAISEALGPYSSTISKDVFLDTGLGHTPGSHSSHLLHLRHKRLTWANEPQGGGRLNIALLKELTGGGAITARGAYEKDLMTFMPTHTLLINTNHLPYADAEEKALWERLHVIPFNMRFVEQPQGENERPRDVQLSEKLREEVPGILAWIVRGCLEWQRIGLSAPDEVLMAVKDYRAEQDTLQHFLDECCVRQEGVTVAANALYRRYDAWCRSGNIRPLNIQNFGRQLTKKGIERVHATKGSICQGIGLSDET